MRASSVIKLVLVGSVLLLTGFYDSCRQRSGYATTQPGGRSWWTPHYFGHAYGGYSRGGYTSSHGWSSSARGGFGGSGHAFAGS